MNAETPTLELTQTAEDAAELAIRPDGGVPATLYVVPIDGPVPHWYVKATPEGGGFISRHTAFDKATAAAVRRGKQYLASYKRTAKHRKAAA